MRPVSPRRPIIGLRGTQRPRQHAFSNIDLLQYGTDCERLHSCCHLRVTLTHFAHFVVFPISRNYCNCLVSIFLFHSRNFQSCVLRACFFQRGHLLCQFPAAYLRSLGLITHCPPVSGPAISVTLRTGDIACQHIH